MAYHFIQKLIYYLKKNFIEVFGVTLVQKVTQVSSVQLQNTPSVHCIVCSPPRVKSPVTAFFSKVLKVLKSQVLKPNCQPRFYKLFQKQNAEIIHLQQTSNRRYIKVSSSNEGKRSPSENLDLNKRWNIPEVVDVWVHKKAFIISFFFNS